MSERIGSRNDITNFYYYNDIVYVVCGCFRGTLPEFEERVNEVYPEGKHHDEYAKEIGKVKILFNAEGGNAMGNKR